LELISLNGHAWYAVYTQVNFEKRVAASLQAQGFEVFLPLMKGWDRRRGVLLWKPAFPRYLFVHCRLTPAEWRAVQKTRGVVEFVGMERPCPIPDEEIRSVWLTLNGTQGEVEGHPLLKVGDRVEVVAGPLKGVVGYLLEIGKQHRLVVGVELLGRAVSATVDAKMVRPCPF
jgi:transcription antitermination factor NusG